MSNDIKLGVSLYSFSSEFINGVLDLEGILKKVKAMGYQGVEIVAAQMVPEYPYPSDKWLEALRNLLAKYELTPVCWSAYVDMGLASDRDLTSEEIIQFTVNDLIYAKKAGFPLVRSQYSITPEIFRAMLPWCKSLDMKLTVEMHYPHHPKVPLWQEYIKLCKEEGEGYLGIVPDCGIFQNHPHKLFLDQMLERGFPEEKLDALVALHDSGVALETAAERLGLSQQDISVAEDMYSTFCQPAKVEQLKELLPVSPYIHGKFYYAQENEDDPCIPYREIFPELQRLGFKGYVACEYEGHHFVDCFEVDTVKQLERYVSMQRRILGE